MSNQNEFEKNLPFEGFSHNAAEDPLEALLDEESDDEFGEIVLRDQARERSGKPVKLAEWSAQDFSSIYLRFRPHLERHARRFLSNPSQVDEVVQDAFLYLMVSLPELDSEIGVLRFLKWKTRLLALDVIRASGKAHLNSIDDVPEPESSEPEVSSFLEQQDDAAVVRLALSKLNPRHREVLIASMYEEKSTEQIAEQVGLSENATRQLIFRARSAFKKALIGDVDTSGMSAAAILSVAARKAAAEGKKIGASAMALVALVVMSLSVWPMLSGSRNQQNIAIPTPETSSETKISESEQPEVVASEEPEEPTQEEVSPESSPAETVVAAPSPVKTKAPATSKPTSTPEATEEPQNTMFDSARRGSVFVLDESFSVSASNGLSASFVFNQTKDPVFRSVIAYLTWNGKTYTIIPDNFNISDVTDSTGVRHFIFETPMKYVFDSQGQQWSETELAKGTLRIQVTMAANGVDVKDVLLVAVSPQ